MNSYIFIFLFSSFLNLYLHQTNALLYKLQTTHPHAHQQAANIPMKDLMVVPTSSENFRQELVYLFMTPPTTQFAYISMPSLQILCWLRLAKIPFYALSNQFLLASPSGKPQFAQINGQIFDDPNKIIEEIEKIEAERNKKPQKMVEKSENEIKMEKALDTMQNIIYEDLCLFHKDRSSQFERWMKDDGLKEQMFLALTKMDAAKGKETDKRIQNHNNDEFKGSNLARNEAEFMKAYFNIKNGRSKTEKDNFLINHGIDFMRLHDLVFPKADEELSKKMEENIPCEKDEFAQMMEVEGSEDEEYEDENSECNEIREVRTRKKKKLLRLMPERLFSNFLQQLNTKSDFERFKEFMDKRVADRLDGELAKLKMSMDGFCKELSEKKISVLTEEEKKRMEQEEMGKRIAQIPNIAVQRAQSIKKGWQIAMRNLNSSISSASQSQNPQFEYKMIANCNEDDLVTAFKYAVDVLASIVKPFSYDERFLFHKKATATEARLLATLGHLFTSHRIILPKLKEFMAHHISDVLSTDNTISGLQFSYVPKKIFLNKKLQILSEYFDMRKGQLGLDLKTLDALKTMPWNLEKMMVDEQKYTGLYPFKTNSMDWLPKLAEYWSVPERIADHPLDEETAGPDHKLLTTILTKIATYFWQNLNGKEYFNDIKTNYFACRIGLMHIVAAYLCELDYKKGSINSKKEKDKASKCSEWHLKEFKKLDEFKQGLLQPVFVPMKSIIYQTIEEYVGIEGNIFEAIKQAMNGQEKGKKEKGKSVESELKLDLF